MKKICWNLLVPTLMMIVVCALAFDVKETLANSSYTLSSNRISFNLSGPRIYGGRVIPLRLEISSPRKEIRHIVIQSRGNGSQSNVYAALTIDVNRNGVGQRINVPDAKNLRKVVNFPISRAACGENTLYASAWVQGGMGRVGSPSNALKFWKDCEPPRVQIQLKRKDGTVLGGIGHNQVYGNSVLLEINARDDQGIRDIVVKDAGLNRILGSQQYRQGLKRNVKFQVRIPVVGAYDDQPVGIRVFVRDWVDTRSHRVEASAGYTQGTVEMTRVTPARVAPGQTIRIVGHFNTKAFSSHRFQLWLVPSSSGRGIDLPLKRVAETALDATVPRNLQSGRYKIFVRDMRTNNSYVNRAQMPLEITQTNILNGVTPRKALPKVKFGIRGQGIK